ncbi:MoaD/ThiS family protein [Chloroflexota bacterium]
MSIKVYPHSYLHRHTNGLESVEVEGSTVGQCLDQLIKRFPIIREKLFDKHGKLYHHVFLSINMDSTHAENLDKSIEDGDELHIVLMIDGG